MGFRTQPLQAWRQEFEEVLGVAGCWLVEWRVGRPVEGHLNWRIFASIRPGKTSADWATRFPPLLEELESCLTVHKFDERVQRARDGATEVGIQIGAPDVPSPSVRMRAERDARAAQAAERQGERERMQLGRA